MVGGWVIEAATQPNDLIRLWCVNGSDELAVLVEDDRQNGLPELGSEIWWQAGRVYFDGDRKSLRKIANSHDPRDS